jgi:signal transduction histidine kinase/sensor domain CHASE-containing protein
MNLRYRTPFIIAVTLLGLQGLLGGIGGFILERSLRSNEQAVGEQLLSVVVGLLEQQQQQLAERFSDWSAWDDARAFVTPQQPQSAHQDFISANLGPVNLRDNLNIDLMAFFDRQRRLVFARFFAWDGQPMPVPPALLRLMQPGQPLLLPDGQQQEVLLTLDGQVLLLSSQPIISSERIGPSQGRFLVGRWLSAAQLAAFTSFARSVLPTTGLFGRLYDEKTNLNISIHSQAEIIRQNLPRYPKNWVVNRKTLPTLAVTGQTATNVTHAADAADVIVVETSFEGTADQWTNNLRLLNALFLLLVTVVLGLILFWQLNIHILRRLFRLEREVSIIGVAAIPTSDPQKLFVDGNDEISTLTTSINTMLERLQTSHSDLLLAKQQAELASQAKSRFLSRVSHELRTPMNAVLGFGQLLEMGQLKPAEREYTGEIIRAGRHLLGIIDELLDMVQAESGQLRLAVEPVKLHALIEECVQQLQPLAQAKSLEIRQLVETDLGLWTDRRRLFQVVLNLISNAIKYNKKHGYIEIKTTVIDSMCCISIEDSGIGLDANQQKRLFVPFDRLGAEYGDVQGSGLGLSVVKQFIEALAGHIEVESTPGQGSIFRIWLPLQPV